MTSDSRSFEINKMKIFYTKKIIIGYISLITSLLECIEYGLSVELPIARNMAHFVVYPLPTTHYPTTQRQFKVQNHYLAS
jgi:hypothetical protein